MTIVRLLSINSYSDRACFDVSTEISISHLKCAWNRSTPRNVILYSKLRTRPRLSRGDIFNMVSPAATNSFWIPTAQSAGRRDPILGLWSGPKRSIRLSTSAGHHDRLVCGRLESLPVVAMKELSQIRSNGRQSPVRLSCAGSSLRSPRPTISSPPSSGAPLSSGVRSRDGSD